MKKMVYFCHFIVMQKDKCQNIVEAWWSSGTVSAEELQGRDFVSSGYTIEQMHLV